MGTAEILRIIYKHYGGIDFFKDKSSFLFAKCLENACNKEAEIPNLINEIIKLFFKKGINSNFNIPSKNKMRSAEEILNDYGLGGGNYG